MKASSECMDRLIPYNGYDVWTDNRGDPEYQEPWTETGMVVHCLNCGITWWQFISDPDECWACFKSWGLQVRRPTIWERFVRWLTVSGRITPKEAAKRIEAQQNPDLEPETEEKN